jgi:chemotaxis protein MotB
VAGIIRRLHYLVVCRFYNSFCNVPDRQKESFGYAKTSLGGKPAVIDSGNISIVPQIRPQAAPLPLRKQETVKGRPRAEEKDFITIKASLEAYLLKKAAQDKVNISITRRGLVVSLKEAGFFDSGSATVKKESMELLNTIAESLINYSNSFRVEGHTDNVPIRSGTFRSNWELSTTRATNIVHYMVDSFEYEPNRMSAAGYGEYKPVADNATTDGRSKNRRVDLVMLSGASEMGEP